MCLRVDPWFIEIVSKEFMYRIGQEEIEELRCVIESRQLFRSGNAAGGHQQEVVRFEREWGETIGRKYALCLSGGGTAALICGLVGMEIGPGDEVIVPAYTWMATALAVLAVGAIPVLADIDESLSLDPLDLERKYTPQTRAVIPVHMTGRPANMQAICDFARANNMFVLEDCSQADGGSYKGRRVGSWGDAGAFSFNDYKIMTCGEGGALVTDDLTIYERALVYHDAGTAFRPYGQDLSIPIFLGQQYRASELMGAVLRIQLQRLDGILSDLRRMKNAFHEQLSDVANLRFAPGNDPEGDCGVLVAFQFDDEASARAFASAPGVEGGVPIDSDKHVYTNWTPILEKNIGHHPAVNPYNYSQNQNLRTDISNETCAKTLGILARTVYLAMNPDWTDEQLQARIACCRDAMK